MALATLALLGCGAPRHHQPGTPPLAPEELVVTRLSEGIVNLQWSGSDAWGYRVERAATLEGTWVMVAATAPNETTATDRNVDPSRTFFYAVRAFNAAGYSEPSNVAVASSNAAPPGEDADGGALPDDAGTPGPGNNPPTVALTNPLNNAQKSAPGSFSLVATARDSDGTVSKVEFYQGTTLLGTATASPYTYQWNAVTAGSYQVTARAYDNQGVSADSSAITVKVNPAPTFSVVSLSLMNSDNDTPIAGFDPLPNNAVIDRAALGTPNITLRANTSGAIGSVKFGLDGVDNSHTENAAPYALAGDTAGDLLPFAFGAGAHTLVVTPYDAMGAAGNAGGKVTRTFTVR